MSQPFRQIDNDEVPVVPDPSADLSVGSRIAPDEKGLHTGKPVWSPALVASGLSANAVSIVQETLQMTRAYRVLQFLDRLGLDLTDPFTGDLEDLTDLLKGVGVTVF